MIVLHFLQHESVHPHKETNLFSAFKRLTSCPILTVFISKRNIWNIFRLNKKKAFKGANSAVADVTQTCTHTRAFTRAICLHVM